MSKERVKRFGKYRINLWEDEVMVDNRFKEKGMIIRINYDEFGRFRVCATCMDLYANKEFDELNKRIRPEIKELTEKGEINGTL